MFRMLPFIFRNREWLDQNPSFQKHVIGDIGESKFSFQKWQCGPAQHDSHVGVAIFAVVSPRPATKQDEARYVVLVRNSLCKDANRALRFGIDIALCDHG